MTEESNEVRLLRLEEKIAYQDKTIAELNDVVVALNRRATELRERLAAVERVVRSELGGQDAPHEKPPHY